jgi:hypothetical protein
MTQQVSREQSQPTFPTENLVIPLEMPRKTRWALNGVLMGLVLANLIAFVVQSSLPNPAPNGAVPNLNTPTPSPVVVMDKDRQVALTLSTEWTIEERPGVLIHGINRPRDFAVMVFKESKVALSATDPRYGDLDAYGELMRSLLIKEMPDGTQSPAAHLTVGGFPAVQSEVTGTSKGLKMTFLHTIVATPETYYQVRVITTAARFPDVRSQLAEVAASFRVQGISPSSP